MSSMRVTYLVLPIKWRMCGVGTPDVLSIGGIYSTDFTLNLSQ